MKRTLLLVRHGESEGNAGRMFTGHSASPLSALGERQAEAVADALAPLGPTALYSSDLVRALSTVAPLASRTGLAVTSDPRLRERDMGSFVGVRFETLEAEQPEAWKALRTRDPEFTPPGGESHRQCGARVNLAIDDILAAHPSGVVVVVSHGVALHHVLRRLLRSDDTGLVFPSENCAVHRFDWSEPTVMRVSSLNDTRHLDHLRGS